MSSISKEQKPSNMITFYHDIEQDIDSDADPEKCRATVKEFLKMEKKYDAPVTYNVVGKLFEEQPDLIEWIIHNNQEVAFHSYNHQPDWKPEYYSNEVDLCRKVSPIPRGYRSPRDQWNGTTLESLWRNGFLWDAEMDRRREPYFIHAGLVRLPIGIDDWPVQTGALDTNEWLDKFSDMFKSRRYFAIGSHDFVTSLAPEERLKAWESALRTAIENRALLVSFSQAAELYRRAMLSRFYNKNAQTWNQTSKTYYRTRRFREVIRAEASKLDQPVIADLGSGGGLLSSPLQDIAKTIYCVDNAPGMIAQVEPTNVLQPRLGEVTDSGLPSDSIDLIICARVIEYLFYPDSLADEIKRIGRMGATYIVTFPALRDNVPSNEKSRVMRYRTPDDRIRHYFSPDEIKKWADQIGAGRLFGIQYDDREPDSPEIEKDYRSIEENPPVGTCPTNWVYAGTIQNKSPPRETYGRRIPLSDFEFHDQEVIGVKESILRLGLRFPKTIRRIGKRILVER